MVSEGANWEKGETDGFMVYPVPFAGDVLQIVTGIYNRLETGAKQPETQPRQSQAFHPSRPPPIRLQYQHADRAPSTPDGSKFTLDSSITPENSHPSWDDVSFPRRSCI